MNKTGDAIVDSPCNIQDKDKFRRYENYAESKILNDKNEKHMGPLHCADNCFW